MSSSSPLRFKIATELWEFDQIHRLNYKTFAEEIPQHERSGTGMLVDKFHDENVYFICLQGGRVIGMMAMRGNRPFSLDHKLPDLDSYLPPGRTVCEVRLLAVEKGHRNGRVFLGLGQLLSEVGHKQGFDLAIISGTTRQEKLYRHLGFIPFGPQVGNPGAWYQPMYLTLETVLDRAHLLPPEPQSFLPGPVAIGEEVRGVFGGPPVSHRSRAFMRNFQKIKQDLCALTGAGSVEIFVGSGTLANDVVAGQISLLAGRGLILNNGEFGTRLVDHATRWGLSFGVHPAEWGEVFQRAEVERALDAEPDLEWLWSVHCETSTTVLNDIEMLREVTAARRIKLCLDCTSSVGTVPVDLSGAWLASSVSGKGLGSLPGLSMVFYNHPASPAPTALPRYLDLGTYAANDGVPYTHSSNLVYALKKAMERFTTGDPYEQLRELSGWLRAELRGMGFRLIAADEHTSPAIVTITLPEEISAERVGDRLEEAGFLISYRSSYLLKRNWIQICLMGESSRERLRPVLRKLGEFCGVIRGPKARVSVRPWKRAGASLSPGISSPKN